MIHVIIFITHIHVRSYICVAAPSIYGITMIIPTEADVTLLIYELSTHILLHHLGHALSVS